MIKPNFLWDNVLRGITPAFSGPVFTSRPPANATDWLDYTFFQADTGTLDYTMTSNVTIDGWSIYVAKYTGTGSQSIVLQYESAPASFTTLGTITLAGGKLTLDSFGEVTVLSGRRIRFVISAGTEELLIRQLVVGQILEAEQGQYVTVQDPGFIGGLVVNNMISMNGSVLSRTVRRIEYKGKIMLENLTPDWVNSEWEPMVRHMTFYPLIYQWNPRDKPNVVTFSTADKIVPPKHMESRGDRLMVDVPMRHLVADENEVIKG